MTSTDPRPGIYEQPEAYQEIALVELVDRLLDKGVVLAGDVTLSVAGIDLAHVSLRLLVSSAERMLAEGADRTATPKPDAGESEERP